jgi:hypothetical protein
MATTTVTATQHNTLRVVRMQLINRQTYVWVPILIIGASLALSIVIFALIPYDEPKYSGASQAPLWYFLAVGIQALTLSFPFSQAMSVTRRAFFGGTLLTAAMTSAILAVVFIVGGLIETATDGWGLNGYYFKLDWVWQDGPAVAGLAYFVIAMVLFLLGFTGATIYKRFGLLWLTVAWVAVAVVMVGAAALVTFTDSWPVVWTGIANAGPLGVALWGIVVGAVLSLASYGLIRRATP